MLFIIVVDYGSMKRFEVKQNNMSASSSLQRALALVSPVQGKAESIAFSKAFLHGACRRKLGVGNGLKAG
ncbi:hypothetical protein V6N13_128893 [Hibiscus sabdariffa]